MDELVHLAGYQAPQEWLSRRLRYSANTAPGIRRAVQWYMGKDSQLTPLPESGLWPGGGIYDEATGSNEQGQFVGWSGPASGMEHIALWDRDGSVYDLVTLGGHS